MTLGDWCPESDCVLNLLLGVELAAMNEKDSVNPALILSADLSDMTGYSVLDFNIDLCPIATCEP